MTRSKAIIVTSVAYRFIDEREGQLSISQSLHPWCQVFNDSTTDSMNADSLTELSAVDLKRVNLTSAFPLLVDALEQSKRVSIWRSFFMGTCWFLPLWNPSRAQKPVSILPARREAIKNPRTPGKRSDNLNRAIFFSLFLEASEAIIWRVYFAIFLPWDKR